jgi:hypothetical protein
MAVEARISGTGRRGQRQCAWWELPRCVYFLHFADAGGFEDGVGIGLITS